VNFSLSGFFEWCVDVDGYEEHDCDESQHFYYLGEHVGGWAGDTCQYFIASNEKVDDLLKLYREENPITYDFDDFD
jgi:UDP-2,3-diacylglucosamine pyrophosphatase LpxH